MNYNILDLFKFFFAFAVVAIHTHVLEGLVGCDIEVLRIVELLAVPYFFVVSGFFLGRRLTSGNEQEAYKKYISRILKMYVIWCAVYLPINLYYELAVYDFSVTFTVFDLLRGWLLVGENPYSWPLWYLLASIVAVSLILHMRKRGVSFRYILVIALSLYLIGYVYSSYHDELASMGAIGKYATSLYDKSFRTTRNGIFEGLLYISLGISLARSNTKVMSSLSSAGGVILLYFNETLALPLLGYGLVGLLIHLRLKGKREVYQLLRKLSTIIYLVHMLVIVLLLNIDSSIDNFSLFLYASGITLLTSLIVSQLVTKKHGLWLGNLF